MITHPIDLWSALQKDAGLELRRGAVTAGRDADLEAAILAQLCTAAGVQAASGSVEDLLRADARLVPPRISVELLLEAILAEQQGFAAMMSDILETLVMAEAATTKDPLAVSFSFDETSEPLRLTLEAFRQQVERITSTLVFQRSWPTKQQRWQLSNGLADIVNDIKGRRAPFPPVAAPPATPVSGHPRLDAALHELTQLVSEFCAQCMAHGTDRKVLFQTVLNRFRDQNDPLHVAMVAMAGDATDGWDVDFIDLIKSISDSARNNLIDPETAAQRIETLLADIPSRRRQVEQKYTELLDVLNLPVWKKRHELYSVWVGTALLRVAKKYTRRLDFHPVDGVLSFAFGGSRLASYDWDGQQFDVWAEFRSKLTVPSEKRKEGIQPDFRVMQVALGGTDNDKTRFVLECKHYLKPSLSNFTQAAQDYSQCCPYADVFVVNHGPADHDLLSKKLSDDVAGRVKFLGEMTAGARKADLESAIGETLFPGAAAASDPAGASPAQEARSEGKRAMAGTIRLAWNAPLRDLDLSLQAMDRDGKRQAEINFASPGALQAAPYAMLHEDIQAGPGAEQIDIAKWDFDRYEIVVTNFSQKPDLLDGLLRCTVAFGTTLEIHEFPSTENGRAAWNVGVIQVINGVPHFQRGGLN